MEKNNKIAHISDAHVRFGSRHQEYKTVFNRIISDVKKEKPRRIVFTGDLFHLKINLSPAAIDIASKFLTHLSKIAPVDIILGNHDMNEQDLSQGNAIQPLIDLMENGYTITQNNPMLPTPMTGYGIYFYLDSGFYDIDDDLVYGVFSLWDHVTIKLNPEDRKLDKKYVALFHGPLQGCMSDNGYIMKGEDLVRVSAFDNFDIAMLGDIHEYQTFERNDKEDVAYAGSCLQMHYGESLEKSYLIWDLETCTHKRKFILNEHGFSKLNISKGEDVWERINDMKFSFDPRKTKVYIEIEDDAENENLELKNQIRRYIKSKWGCESIDIQFIKTTREKVFGVDTTALDFNNKEVFSDILRAWLVENSYDNIDDVLALHEETDKELNLLPTPLYSVEYDIEEMYTYNLFTHPAQQNYFDFKNMTGVIGIFGQNYSGKSNIIRALVWILYGDILGSGDSHKVVNLYTGKSTANGTVIINISGTRYKIYRSIQITTKKDGSTKAAYQLSFSYEVKDGDTSVWIPEESDRAAKEKPEVKKLILDAIGTFSNFTKVSLQTQGGADDYLSLKQQPKNDLIREYFGLKPCDLRHDLVNPKFNQIRNMQKQLGDPIDIEKQIEECQAIIKAETTNIELYEKERLSNTTQINIHNEQIVEHSKELIKIGEIHEHDITELQNKINAETEQIASLNDQVYVIDVWLQSNFRKEAPSILHTQESLNKKMASERAEFSRGKEEFIKLESWLKTNLKQKELSTDNIQAEIDKANEVIYSLNDNLKLARGEKCPTCGHVKHEANPAEEKRLLNEISLYQNDILNKKAFIEQQKKIINTNLTIEKESIRLDTLKNTLQATKLRIDQLKLDIEYAIKAEENINHNLEIEKRERLRLSLNETIAAKTALCEKYKSQITLLIDNEKAIENNKLLNEKIKQLKDSIVSYKYVNIDLEEKLKISYRIVTTQENNIEMLQDKLNKVKESVKTFNKYSIYLQAVSREGIPAQVIRKRLPIVNYKINSILKDIVNFKIEMYVNSKGDVLECFYFNEDKSDALSLSSASGSQKFIGSIAIRDALHYVSCLVKPSFCIIDEGFGTLDEEKVLDIGIAVNYLKNKYKNVFILTHKNEIKDFVDHVIMVSKTHNGLAPELIEANPNAGISQFNFS